MGSILSECDAEKVGVAGAQEDAPLANQARQRLIGRY
jgi:hypothetical protein